MITPELPSRIK